MKGSFVAGFEQHQHIHDAGHMHLLVNADVSECGSQYVLRLAGDVFTGHAIVDEELAVVGVCGADSGDLHEREMCMELKGCRQEVHSMAQLHGSQEQQRRRSVRLSGG